MAIEAKFFRKDDGTIEIETPPYQGTSFKGPLVTYADPAADSSDPDSDHAHKFSKVHTAIKKHDHRVAHKEAWRAFLASEARAAAPVVEVVHVAEVPESKKSKKAVKEIEDVQS